MAAGCAPVTPAILPGPMSANLSGASLPQPSSGGWCVAGLVNAAALRVAGDPTVNFLNVAGRRGSGHDLAVFDRVHVIPRQVDLGAVITDQELEVEVWNAFMTLARSLEDLTIEGAVGIKVDNPDGLPAHFAATQSKIFVVRALADGDPDIDDVVTWVFAGVDPAGTALSLSGFRLIPWPFDPDMNTPIRERYGYLTSVLTAYSGQEQRIGLRDIPTGSMQFGVTLLEARDAQHANAILYGSQARAIGVPLWQYQTPLLQTASLGGTEILFDTTSLPFYAGGLVFLWRSPYEWEAQTIDEVQSDRLILTRPLRRSWAVPGVQVMPLVKGRLGDEEGFTWIALAMGANELTFDIDGYKP